MFERFTDKARRSLVLAQEEARILNHNFIGTEHVLLGLLRLDGSIAAEILQERGVTLEDVRQATVERVGSGIQDSAISDAEALKAIGIDLDEVRRAIEDSFGAGALDGTQVAVRNVFRRRQKRRGVAPPFTPRTKALLGRSLREALQMGHNYIGTEHLLMAAARPQSGLASQILAERDLGYEAVREQVKEKLSGRRR